MRLRDAAAALYTVQKLVLDLQIGEWLTERAQVVEEATGQLQIAAQLLALAQKFSPENALARQLSVVAIFHSDSQGDCSSHHVDHTDVSCQHLWVMCVQNHTACPMVCCQL